MNLPLRPRLPFHSVAWLVLAMALAGCAGDQGGEPEARPAMVVRPEPASSTFSVFPGEVRAREETALGFRVGGKIARRLVDVGDRVKAGQLLAELDPDDLSLQAEAARAQLRAAQADLEQARNELERHRTLLDRKLISASLFEARETAFKAAEARVGQARAQMDVARNQATYTRLQANADGVIAQRLAEAGQVVAAGQTVFVLAADGEREIAISLPESAIDRYRVGMPVLVSLWSDPDMRLAGTLRELSPAADANARTYAARIQLEGAAAGIELGQSARAIFAQAGAQALAVPLPAVTADAGRHYVWVVDPQTLAVQRREVSIGPFLDQAVPVTSGLEAGEWVVAAGVHLLREGQKVRPVDRDNRPVAPAAGA
ncbi:efflux RND transporter periplasmic adaptor subunit [Pseudomarimonas salicorniae]|uniref:Efflux RND transporter periplasmic adaptor subunit n=1 Tax=Pseudomarimonas salicorniae TaxID=2933270 RepID=A0ABT0GHE2_9GAMM|nr:efflux RND transporter periplasmic adaptor subunit [Lysobacter sp. CAU 1642]MCK7593445.1 efflux RND transporter periplasmic adaptor subunit [Lysobacter sp. CAU 1642]